MESDETRESEELGEDAKWKTCRLAGVKRNNELWMDGRKKEEGGREKQLIT